MMITENPRQMHLSWDDAVTEAAIATAEECWISDAAAQTIAAGYMAPVATSWNMTSLAQGRPFDTDGLREEIDREISLISPLDADAPEDTLTLAALRDWINGQEVKA